MNTPTDRHLQRQKSAGWASDICQDQHLPVRYCQSDICRSDICQSDIYRSDISDIYWADMIPNSVEGGCGWVGTAKPIIWERLCNNSDVIDLMRSSSLLRAHPILFCWRPPCPNRWDVGQVSKTLTYEGVRWPISDQIYMGGLLIQDKLKVRSTFPNKPPWQ